MKPHPRIRKTIKWGGAVVTVLLVVGWLGSGAYGVARYDSGRIDLAVNRGLAVIGKGDPWLAYGEEVRWNAWRNSPYDLSWWWEEPGPPYVWGAGTPLWVMILGAAAFTASAWWFDTLARRRARLNLCPTCNYDRTGLAIGAVCPECGHGTVA